GRGCRAAKAARRVRDNSEHYPALIEPEFARAAPHPALAALGPPSPRFAGARGPPQLVCYFPSTSGGVPCGSKTRSRSSPAAPRAAGLAAARRYVAEGARVPIADIDAAAGEAAARALGQARFVATDVGDAGNAENVVAEACRAFGDLDILVNNAGIIHGAD